MDFFRGQNTAYFSWEFFSKYDTGPVKLPGISRNGPLESVVLFNEAVIQAEQLSVRIKTLN